MYQLRRLLVGVGSLADALILIPTLGFAKNPNIRHRLDCLGARLQHKLNEHLARREWKHTKLRLQPGRYRTREGLEVVVLENTHGWGDGLPFIVNHKGYNHHTVDERGFAYPPTGFYARHPARLGLDVVAPI